MIRPLKHDICIFLHLSKPCFSQFILDTMCLGFGKSNQICSYFCFFLHFSDISVAVQVTEATKRLLCWLAWQWSLKINPVGSVLKRYIRDSWQKSDEKLITVFMSESKIWSLSQEIVSLVQHKDWKQEEEVALLHFMQFVFLNGLFF